MKIKFSHELKEIYRGEHQSKFKYSLSIPNKELNYIEISDAENKFLEFKRSQKIMTG